MLLFIFSMRYWCASRLVPTVYAKLKRKVKCSSKCLVWGLNDFKVAAVSSIENGPYSDNSSVQRCIYQLWQLTMWISTSIHWQWNVMRLWACLYGKCAISNDNIIIINITFNMRLIHLTFNALSKTERFIYFSPPCFIVSSRKGHILWCAIEVGTSRGTLSWCGTLLAL